MNKVSFGKSNDNKQPNNSNQIFKTSQKQVSKQKLVLDCHFSNQVFFGVTSCAESIMIKYQNPGMSSQDFKNKVMGNYDKVDYSLKTLSQLRNQLQSQVFLFQTSRKVFAMENPNAKWQLPTEFNEKKARVFFNNFIKLANQHNDKASIIMAQDILRILNGDLNYLESQNLDLKLNYTPEQVQKHNQSFVQNAINSTEVMHQQQKKVANLKDVTELTANINYKSQNYHYFQDQAETKQNQIIHQNDSRNKNQMKKETGNTYNHTFVSNQNTKNYAKKQNQHYIQGKKTEKVQHMQDQSYQSKDQFVLQSNTSNRRQFNERNSNKNQRGQYSNNSQGNPQTKDKSWFQKFLN